MTQGEKTLNLAREVWATAIELSEKLKFDKNHSRHLHIVTLYGSMLEFFSNMILLTNDGPKTSIPILVRSQLEALVDLINLCDDATYGYTLEISEQKSYLKVFDEATNGNNQYLDKVSSFPDLEERIAKHQSRLQELIDKGTRVLTIKEKFDKAGMINEYVTIYAELCAYSHNTIHALVNKHIEKTNEDFNVVLYRLTTLDEIEHYLGISSNLLLQATERIHSFLTSPCAEELTKLRSEFDAFVSAHEST